MNRRKQRKLWIRISGITINKSRRGNEHNRPFFNSSSKTCQPGCVWEQHKHFFYVKTEHVCLRSHITQQNLWPVSGNVSHSGCFCSREMRKPTGNQGPHCGHFILCAKMTPFLRFNFNIWTLWQKLTGLNSEKIIMLYYMIITAVVTFTSDQTFAEHLKIHKNINIKHNISTHPHVLYIYKY